MWENPLLECMYKENKISETVRLYFRVKLNKNYIYYLRNQL